MHSYEERGLDKYPTPPEALLALMAAERLPLRLWEPACGKGILVDVLRAHGRDVFASDIEGQGCPESCQLDFLSPDAVKIGSDMRVDAIITNPPFKLLKKGWVERCLELVPQVYLLCRIQFLEGASTWRCNVLEHSGLRRVYVFRDRLPMMHRDGWEGPRASSKSAFAWFCWRRGWTGLNSIKRISWKDPGSPLPVKRVAMPKDYCRLTPDMFPTQETVT